MPAVTVFLSSSTKVAPAFFQAAADLGAAIAREGWTLVYGGNRIGPMQSLADAARAAGGKVIGVTPRLMVDENIHDTLCDELVVTDSMRQRKQIMEERADAFIALPGGLGTLEELFEIIVGRQLGYHSKPVVILNIAGYYDPLLGMLRHGIEQGFIRTRAERMWHVAGTVEEAMAHLRASTRPSQSAPTTEFRAEAAQ
jgi:uncharacterized protein (TIGR00730 family)